MGFPPDQQNIFLAVLLAGTGGVLEVLATAVVAVPDAKEKQGVLVSDRTIKCSLLTNVILQICASVAGNTMSTWFGPVSIAGPVFFAAQMVANMVVYGFLTGLENFSKEMRVGTWVVVVGTLMLCVTGPQVQENQDINDLITKWYSILWSSILLTGMGISSIYMACGVNRFEKEWVRAAILLTARGCALSVNLTVSKPFSMKPGMPMVLVWLAFKIVSGAVYTIAIIIQSTSVTQSTFVPMNTTVTLALNAITGIIIWEDWRTVVSWLGYAGSFTLLVLGVYLLLGDVEFLAFMSDNPKYGHKLKLQRMRGRRNLAEGLSTMNIVTEHDVKEDDADKKADVDDNSNDNNNTATENGGDPDIFVVEEGKVEVETAPEVKPAGQPQAENSNVRDRRSTYATTAGREKGGKRRSTRPGLTPRLSQAESTRKAWCAVFGVGDQFLAGRGGRKRQSIFFNR